jgi:type II secretory pathway pseudopilin PulG
MGRTSGGYTIVEVMVVLAITVALFASALVLLSGQEGETQSTQTMQDISSKIQSYVSQINAGSYPGTQSYYCNVLDVSGQPTPTLYSGSGSSDGCIYLGRAIEVKALTGTIYSYIILGTRDTYNTGADTGQLATGVDQANPTPAMDSNQKLVLVDSYTLEGGATVVSSNVTATTNPNNNEYDLVGIYNQPDNSINSGGGNTVLSMRAYPYVASQWLFPQSSQLTSCLEELNANTLDCTVSPTDNVPAISQWSLCIDTGGHDEALDVNASTGGVSTTLKGCGP